MDYGNNDNFLSCFNELVNSAVSPINNFTNVVVLGFRSRPGRLVLVADPKAPVEGLIFLVDEVRMQGGEKLLIATAQPDEPGRP